MKTKTLILSVILLSFLFSFSCDREKTNITEEKKEKITLETSTDEGKSFREKPDVDNKDVIKKETETIKNDEIKVTDRLIVKTGNISIEVEKYDESEKAITDITNKHNGYVSSSNSTLSSAGKKQGVITLRVPVEKFDIILSEISTIGKVVSENVTSSDITEEYIDLEARQKTQKELEQRLLKLLNEKTSQLTEILEIEEKLASVRQKIESFEGKMKYLKSQASYSTIKISLYEPNLLQTSTGGGFFYELGEAVKKGVRGLLKVVIFLIVAIIVLIPFIIIALIVLWYIRRRKMKKQEK